ncbi:uncharacterized protein LOC133330492 [Musca vetustissima]|uniref:uncharacterized protein LOC133330492 n=1 Tax=Musca vetustissima TaxID=27455 RepID=UPI002AB78575|nr:uncharacterized protein LOC133330492 [Musca vetustissima]
MSVLFQSKLIENLSFGHLLQLGGKAENDESWFSISLAMGKSTETEIVDVPFHILVDVAKNKIEFKQRLDGQWLDVDCEEEYDTQIFRQHFHVTIAVDERKFYVGINGHSLNIIRCMNMSTMKLSNLTIEGNLITLNQVDHRKYFTATWPPVQICEKNRLQFSHDIPCRIQPGHIMVVTMKLLGRMDGWFKMDFRHAENIKRIEVHISVRFNLKKIIRNSKLPANNHKKNPDMVEWGDEEIDGSFPFDDVTKPFRLALAFTPKSVKMAKDGVYLFKYGYRTPHVLPWLTGLKIKGQHDPEAALVLLKFLVEFLAQPL